MTIIDRIKFLIQELNGGKQADFAKALGASPQTISSVVKRGSNPSFNLIQSILATYPQVNPYWLILGKGDVRISDNKKYDIEDFLNAMKDQSKIETHGDSTIDNENLKLQIDVLKKEVELLRSSLEDKEEVIAAKNLLIDHLQRMGG